MKGNDSIGFTRQESLVRPQPRLPSNSAAIDADSSSETYDSLQPKTAANVGTDRDEKAKLVTVPDGFYLRGSVWWCYVFGRRVSTGCKDLPGAIARRAVLESTTDPGARQEYVYFVRCGDRIKIGVTRSPGKRWAQIRHAVQRATLAEAKLQILAIIRGDRRTEEAILNGFARFHLGGEWFVASQVLLDFIASQRSSDKGFAR